MTNSEIFEKLSNLHFSKAISTLTGETFRRKKNYSLTKDHFISLFISIFIPQS